jgi:hypothetical protein
MFRVLLCLALLVLSPYATATNAFVPNVQVDVEPGSVEGRWAVAASVADDIVGTVLVQVRGEAGVGVPLEASGPAALPGHTYRFSLTVQPESRSASWLLVVSDQGRTVLAVRSSTALERPR